MTEAGAEALEAALASADGTVRAKAMLSLSRERDDLFRDLGWRSVSMDAVAAVRREYSQHMQEFKASQKADRVAARALKGQVRIVTLIQRGAQWLHDWASGEHGGSTTDLDPWQLYGIRAAWGVAEADEMREAA